MLGVNIQVLKPIQLQYYKAALQRQLALNACRPEYARKLMIELCKIEEKEKQPQEATTCVSIANTEKQ